MKLGDKGEHVIQVDKVMIEEIGIIKFDILGLNTLVIIDGVKKRIGLSDWDIDNKLGASESEGQMKGLLNEAKTFGIESGITKLRNMKKNGGYSDEEIGKYEKLYLGRYYNELIDKVYEPYTTKELLNYVAKGD